MMGWLSRRCVWAVAAVFGTVVLGGCGEELPQGSASPPVMRRLTEAQYRNIIADVFGPQIVITGAFDPIARDDGLAAIGAAHAAVGAGSFERFDQMARGIAVQVVAEPNRSTLVPCTPAAPDRADAACARAFLSKAGRALYRRPLQAAELDPVVSGAGKAADQLGDFYGGLAQGLAGLLVSPAFLYVADTTAPDPAQPGAVRLTPFAVAARLSFFLWNSGPDDVLLQAAESGALSSPKEISRQADRMLASPRLTAGVRALFQDMLALDRFDTLEKDPVLYPNFSHEAAADAREQVLRTVVDQLVRQGRDYRTLFTTHDTVMSAALGRIYRVPVENPEGWVSYRFADNAPYGGIQTFLGFAALYSHPGRSSPTLRGKAIRELLLCQHIPDPPANVDFTLFNDPNSPNKTARDRLKAHSTDPTCAGCHKLMDPLGLALENFDGAGQFRTAENGAPLDTSGSLDGVDFKNAAELGQALSTNAAAPACLVNRVYGYALGHAPARGDAALIAALNKRFADAHYRLTDLLRLIVTSPAFTAVAPPSPDNNTATAAPVTENPA